MRRYEKYRACLWRDVDDDDDDDDGGEKKWRKERGGGFARTKTRD